MYYLRDIVKLTRDGGLTTSDLRANDVYGNLFGSQITVQDIFGQNNNDLHIQANIAGDQVSGNVASFGTYIHCPLAYTSQVFSNSVYIDARLDCSLANVSTANVTTLHAGNTQTDQILCHGLATFQSNVLALSNILVDDGVIVDVVTANAITSTSITGSTIQGGTVQANTLLVGDRNVGTELQQADTAQRLFVRTTGDDTNSGNNWSFALATIDRACAMASEGTTIYVESGQYHINNPLPLKVGVAIVGDNLRNVIINPINRQLDVFHVRSACHAVGLRITHLRAPAACFAFPCVLGEAVISGGSLQSVTILYTDPDWTYQTPPSIAIDPPDNASGTLASAQAVLDQDGKIVDITITDPGSLYTSKPHVSIPPPDAHRAMIYTSPYVQNVSFISGPFTKTGDLIPRTTPLPYDTTDVDPKGGGLASRVDGFVCHPQSPLKSMVADAFTSISQGAISGHLLLHEGYAQYVSCFVLFGHTAYEARSGGYASISKAVVDFGEEGLKAKGHSKDPISTLTVQTDVLSQVVSVQIEEGGSGFTSVPTITFDSGTATATATIDAGSINAVFITSPGAYSAVPNVVVTGGGGSGAVLSAVLSGVGQIPVLLDGGRKPDIGSCVYYDNSWKYVTGVADTVTTSVYEITLFPAPIAALQNDALDIFLPSVLSTGGLIYEFLGSGTTYNALPRYGGLPKNANQTIETPPGKVYSTSTDEQGNFKVGDSFAVNSITGAVTISSDRFNLSGVESIGPFKRNGLVVGQPITEVSNNPLMIDSTGAIGDATVTTQKAVYDFVGLRAPPAGGTTGNVLIKQSNNDYDWIWSNLDERYYTEQESDARFVNVAGDTVVGTIDVTGNITVSDTFTTDALHGNVLNCNVLLSNVATVTTIDAQDVSCLTQSAVDTVTSTLQANTIETSETIASNAVLTNTITVVSIVTTNASAQSTQTDTLAVGSTLSVENGGSMYAKPGNVLAIGSGPMVGGTEKLELGPSVTTIHGPLIVQNTTGTSNIFTVNDLGTVFTDTINASNMLCDAIVVTTVTGTTLSGNLTGDVSGNIVAQTGTIDTFHSTNASLDVLTSSAANITTLNVENITGQLQGGLDISSSNLQEHPVNDGVMYRGFDDCYITVDDNLFVRDTSQATNTANHKFHFDTNTGTFSAVGDVIAYSSDERLKSNILPIENPLETIDRVRGVTFTWKDDVDHPNFSMSGNDMGLIAQDLVRAGLPDCVAPAPFDTQGNGDSVSGERYLTVMYNKLHALQIEAIKALHTKIKILEKRVQ